MVTIAKVSGLQTTTVRLPKPLYEEARAIVETGETDAKSLNDLLIDSLTDKLKKLRRERIDAEFAGMREDSHYQLESKALADDFAASDWEALRAAEKHRR